MDLEGTNKTRLMKIDLNNWEYDLMDLDFGKDWDTSVEMTKVYYKTTTLFFFHHSSRKLEVTRDFKSSFTFELDDDVDQIFMSQDQLIFGGA